MPSRSGWTVLFGAAAAIAIGRLFGILELFIIGAAMAIGVAVAVVSVTLLRPSISVRRWIHPSVLTVGETGRADLLIANRSSLPSPRFDLVESVGRTTTASMTVGGIGSRGDLTAGYRIPADRRGVLEVGPTRLVRRDLLGLAEKSTVVAGSDTVVIAPNTLELAMPALGSGALGRHLLSLSQRLGPGEFHSLRDYVDGDEPRSIHWKASARSENLKVRQHETEGVRRCVVILDTDEDQYQPLLDNDPDLFERAVSIAASITTSADRTGLTTRFVTSPDIDLRGPTVGSLTLRELASVDLGAPLGDIERDPGEGLGVVFVVSTSTDSALWLRTARIADPTLTPVGIFVAGGARGPLAVDAATVHDFADNWARLTGSVAAPSDRRRVLAGRIDEATNG